MKKAFLIALLLAFPCHAEEAVTIASIESGTRIVLSNQQTIRLAGIEVPDEGRAKEILSLFLNQPVALKIFSKDRHGDSIAIPVLSDDRVVQAEMIRAGAARVYPFSGASFVQELLPLEKEARMAKRGLWQADEHKISDAAQPDQVRPEGSFQIVQGVVKNIEKRKGAVYINFGDDYRTDFTLLAAPKDLAGFRKAGKDLLALKDRKIEVRGWLYNRNGPAMDLTETGQLEIMP